MKFSTLLAMAKPMPKHKPNKKSDTAFCIVGLLKLVYPVQGQRCGWQSYFLPSRLLQLFHRVSCHEGVGDGPAELGAELFDVGFHIQAYN